jgi:hypothetical protein
MTGGMTNPSLFRRGARSGSIALLTALLLSTLPSAFPVSAQDAIPLPANAAAVAAKPRRITRQVARGVELIQEIIPAGHPDGPLVVTVVQIDPKVKGVRLEAALGQDRVWGTDPTQGREVVSAITARHKAVVGINAGFFPFAGPPIGLHVQNGEMVTEPASRRTCFLLMKDGRARFEAFTFSASVLAGKEKDAPAYPIHGLNRQPGKGNELLLFSPVFFAATLRAAGRYEVVLSGLDGPLRPNREFTGTVAQVNEGGSTPLKPGTVVLSGGGEGAEFLRRAATPGAKLTFRIDLETTSGKPFDYENIREAVAGAPRIVTDGKADIRLTEEGMGRSFSTTRHPRTAVGETRDGKLLLVTVDGRQNGLSRGMSLTELANLFLKYGAVHAVNLDGGGSSAVVVRNVIANSPSDGRERPVANMLLVHAAPLADARSKEPPALLAPPRPLTVGETWKFAADGNRANDIWGIQRGNGFVTQDGVFHALRPGDGPVLRVGADPAKPARAMVTVIGKEPEYRAVLTLTPDPEKPDQSLLRIRAASATGEPLRAELLTIAVTGGRAESATVSTDSRGDAQVVIVWDMLENSKQNITVSSPNKRFAPVNIRRDKP